jgi:hypothetical protein
MTVDREMQDVSGRQSLVQVFDGNSRVTRRIHHGQCLAWELGAGGGFGSRASRGLETR